MQPTVFKFPKYVAAYPVEDATDAQIVCGRCKEVQDPSAFYLRRARKVLAETGKIRGVRTVCRTCVQGTAYRYRAERMEIIATAKRAGCMDCGIVNLEHPEIFDFDHVNDDKVASVTRWLTFGTVQDLLDEIARCELVCSNCHRIRTVSRPHARASWDTKGL